MNAELIFRIIGGVLFFAAVAGIWYWLENHGMD